MNKSYYVVCLLVTCAILTSHILCVNGHEVTGGEDSPISAMNTGENDMREMKTWMVQIMASLNTIQTELHQQRVELRVIRRQVNRLVQRKTEQQLDRGKCVTDMNTTTGLVATTDDNVATTNGNVEIIATTETTATTSQANVTGSTAPRQLLSGEEAFVEQGFLMIHEL